MQFPIQTSQRRPGRKLLHYHRGSNLGRKSYKTMYFQEKQSNMWLWKEFKNYYKEKKRFPSLGPFTSLLSHIAKHSAEQRLYRKGWILYPPNLPSCTCKDLVFYYWLLRRWRPFDRAKKKDGKFINVSFSCANGEPLNNKGQQKEQMEGLLFKFALGEEHSS